MNWIEIVARFEAAPDDWSLIIDLLDRMGCPNTVLDDDPPTITACVVDVPGAADRILRIESALREAGACVVVANHVPDQDWAEIWKAHFKPRQIGKRFLVRPTWENAEGDLVIVLDPGQAFGTGDHPTTRLCLVLMESAEIEGKRVLDLGCGSGVLAIGASLLGAAETHAVDIDPLSVEVAKENVSLNGANVQCRVGDHVEGSNWDLVVSNIISATLIRLAPQIKGAISPAGCWIVSGIIVDNWSDVLAEAERSGFSLVERLEEDGWVAARFGA